jgi:hypothetical protein
VHLKVTALTTRISSFRGPESLYPVAPSGHKVAPFERSQRGTRLLSARLSERRSLNGEMKQVHEA